jgi:DNA-binding FadR family transcriptional regulator
VPVREALSMLKTLGILNIRHGHKTEVRRMDTEVLQQLLPLAFHLEGEQSFRQISELRLGIEPQAASMVAQRRTQADVDALAELTCQMRAHLESDIPAFFAADFAFHVRIAEATGNPFFVLLMKTFSSYVSHVQTWGCSQSSERRLRAVFSHLSIVEAIEANDPQRAFAEMESHLRYSATHYASNQP